MEVHQQAFIEYYFCKKKRVPIRGTYIIAKSKEKYTIYKIARDIPCIILCSNTINDIIMFLQKNTENNIFFFNDAWWIEDVEAIRNAFSDKLMMMRLGGNEIEKAPWSLKNTSYSIRRKYWRRNLSCLNYIVANSNFSEKRLINMGVPLHSIIKIRGGVNSNLCDMLSYQKEKIRKQIKNAFQIDKKYIITIASRFVLFKGIGMALRALSKSEIQKDTFILLVGDGPIRDEIYNLCVRLFDRNQYLFTGSLENNRVIEILAASDLTLNSSLLYESQSGDGKYIHTETMGRTMMESICVGTKILATNVGGTKELFDENDNIGIIVQPNISCIKEGIDKLPLLLQTQMNVKYDYSWDNVFNQYNTLIINT